MSCPICNGKTDPKYRPFCSRRCADIDLGNWLTEAYSVPSEEPEDIEIMEDQAESQQRWQH